MLRSVTYFIQQREKIAEILNKSMAEIDIAIMGSDYRRPDYYYEGGLFLDKKSESS